MRIASKPLGTVAAAGLVLTILSAAPAQYGGGSGTPEDPYHIWTPEQMNAIGAEPNDWDKHFKLMANIDLATYPGGAFNSIGYGPTNRKAFRGVFNGNGYTVSNFTWSSADGGYAGLFAYVGGPDAEIKNLGLVDPAIDATSGECVGSLVGRLGGGTLTNCYAKGHSISGGVYVGGLVGSSVGAITHCYATGHVAGQRCVGGLLGSNAMTITRGGSGPRMGRVIGSCSGGSVTGHEEVGGLVGYNLGILTDSYATGSVVGEARVAGSVGGLVGHDSGTIRNCYSTGAVAGNVRVGGLVGYGSRYIASSFWDIETSGQENSAGGEGKTTVQMQMASTFFAWVECGQEAPWTIDEGSDYPRLSWENRPGEPIVAPPLSEFLAGTGTEGDPYLIYATQDLILIGLGLCDWDKHFKLMADIDLGEHAGDTLKTIGLDQQSPFRGVFDGNGHTIANFSYVSTNASYCALFGCVDDPNAEIKNLGLMDTNIDAGAGSYAGSLVGYLGSGTITNCSIEGGVVSGWLGVGGLVGHNHGGTVASCYSSSAVSGSRYAGGLVGRNFDGALVNCHSSGTVTGDKQTGGLVGENLEAIINCYSSTGVTSATNAGGLVGSGYCNNVVGSFWDIETSGRLESAGGTGKTTKQMRTAATFFSWNACGNEGTWTIDEGNDYPRLWWERKPGEIMPALQLQNLVAGAGTEDAPYLIYTAEELNLIGLYPCAWQGHFKLMADLDLGGYAGDEFNVIGLAEMPFSGVFNGNGHGIANFTYRCSSAASIGLFGCVAGPGAAIRDLALIDASVCPGGGYYIGVLVGYLRDATLTHCSSTGTVTGDNYVGGLVGCSNGGTIDNCRSDSIVTASYNTGGLVGYNSAGAITASHSAGAVAGNSYTGGLLGCNGHSSRIVDCYSTSAVRGKYDTGGLLGTNRNLVTQCYSHGAVAGDQDTGGLLGRNTGSVTQCYSAGSVSGGDRTGGLVGRSHGDTIRACFWDTETSGQTASGGGTGKTTAEMQMASTFLDAGWDFIGEAENGTEDIWWILEGQDYPRLWWEAAVDPNVATTQ